jgi:PKD repeat protein
MPGWPVPEVPVPHHEPGRPSKAAGYTTQAIIQDEMGADVTVPLSGLDALLFDGVAQDPFQGNYRMVEENQVFAGLLNTSSSTLGTQTVDIENEALNPLVGTQASIDPVMQTDVTAGDLNGDGIDEQITAWMDNTSGDLHLTIGEMPVWSESPGEIPPKVTAQPAAIGYGDGIMDLVVRGYDGALWHQHFDGSDWGDWSNAGGGLLLSGPAIASRGDGEFDVFAYGFDPVDPARAVVYGRHYGSGGWSESWEEVDASDPGLPISQSLPLPTLPAPAAVSRSLGQVDLFWLNEDHTLHWCGYDGIDCASDQDLGGMLASGPGAVAIDPNEMMVFARGVEDSIWYRAYDSSWGNWELLEMPAGVAASSAPSTVKWDPGYVSVFVQGKDTTSEDSPHALYHNSLTGSAWAGWQMIWEYDESEPFEKLDGGIGVTEVSDVVKIFAQMENGGLGLAEYFISLSDWTIRSLPASKEFEVPLTGLGGDPDLRSPLKVEAGHYWGAGRELYAVAYVTATREISVNLFDIGGGGDGFTPNLLGSYLLNVEYTSADGADDMDLAAGDLNGDGRDEIIVASIDRYRAYTQRLNVLDVSDCSELGCTLTNRAGTTGTTWSGFGVGVNEVSTIHLATGDLNGDGDDEVAVGSTGNYLGDGNWSDILLWVDGDGEARGGRYHGRCDYMDGEGPSAFPGPCTSGDLAVGNFILEPPVTDDIPGPVLEEIAFLSPWIHSCTLAPPTYRRCQRFFVTYVYQLNDSDFLVEMGNYTAGGVGSNEEMYGYPRILPTEVDRAAVLLSDLDVDLMSEEDPDILDEMVVNFCQNGTCTAYLIEPLAAAPTTPVFLTSDISDSLGNGNRAYLAAGDFLGESLRVGPPSFRIQEEMTTPIAFLNLPPMHRDIVWNEDTEENDIVILFDDLAQQPTATYTSNEATTDSSTITSSREWDLSTGFETTVGAFGSSVTTSLDNTYGEKFSKLGSTIDSSQIQQEIVADLYDQIVYNGTTYRIWEYPVLGIPEADKTGGPTMISVVYPFDFGDPLYTNPPSNKQYPQSCDENFYVPGHQTNNIWSYDSTDLGLYGFRDLERLLMEGATTGGSTVTLNIGGEGTDALTSSFHNQFSAGVEYSYENSLDIPLIGKAWDFSFRAYAKGSYGWEDVTTLTTTLNTETKFEIDIPSITPSITFQSYLYKGDGGYYVLDYQTKPDPGSDFWSLYRTGPDPEDPYKPDPAFILNWYGFPDPSSPEPPPCTGKQLFSHDVVIEPQYAEIGDDVTISATVRNFSPKPPDGDVTVRFYRGDPAEDQMLGEDTISDLNRETGAETASITIPWFESYGVGKQQIYAVIDPDDAIDEVHEAGDLIDNNTAFSYIYIAGADYLDPGHEESVPYQSLALDVGESVRISAYLPTMNGDVTERFELIPQPITGISIPGEPFRLDAFDGGQASPPTTHTFDMVPAVIGIHAPGYDVSSLTLYRYTGTAWVDATCSPYQTHRFPSEHLLFVPLCDLTYSLGSDRGIFALSDIAPDLAPEAEFNASPLSGGAPLEVTFTDLSTGNPTSWEWDFGDGSELCYDQNPLNEFTDPGIYTVTLTVENAFGSDVETKVAYINVVEEQKLYLPLIMR